MKIILHRMCAILLIITIASCRIINAVDIVDFDTSEVFGDSSPITIYEEEIYPNLENEAAPMALPVVAALQAFAGLMAAFGITAAATSVYENEESFSAFYQPLLDGFQERCQIAGLAVDLVQAWISDLCAGTVNKASEVYSTFVNWLSSLNAAPETPAGVATCSTGVFSANTPYDMLSIAPNCTSSSQESDIGKYSKYTFTFANTVYGVIYKATSTYYNIIFFAQQPIDVTTNWTKAETGESGSSHMLQDLTVDVNGTTYYCSRFLRILTDYYTTAYMPIVQAGSNSAAITKYLDGTYTTTENDFVYAPGADVAVGEMTVINPGAFDDDTVAVVWPDDITGTLGNVAAGDTTWDDYLTDVGINAAVGDTVIAGDPATDIPVDPPAPGTDLGDMDTYVFDLRDLFPFCLPFDLIEFFSILDADPVAPEFVWKFTLPNGGTYSMNIDLSPYDNIAALMRKLEMLSFIIGLIYITRSRMIRG